MADYKELLRRAISALPENNGTARRAVYEKARSALVGQLRAITPPLPARDITQHRLQLEDCIRQVEQEASEAVIMLGRETVVSQRPILSPKQAEAAPPPAPVGADLPRPADPEPRPASTSIEDIISQAEAVADEHTDSEVAGPPVAEIKVEAPKLEPRVIPTIVSRVLPHKVGPTSPVPQQSNVSPLKGPTFEPRRDPLPLAANAPTETRVSGRLEPSLGNQAVARQQVVEPALIAPMPVETALSTVREVEVEPDPNEAQGVIERAIEVLDREARGESTPALSEPIAPAAKSAPDSSADYSGLTEPPAQRGGAGLTIFLVVFAVLLAGAGGAGFWAWREGYVDLDQMFGRAAAPITETAVAPTVTTPTLDPVQTADDAVAGPGNTTAASTPTPGEAQLSSLEIEDRLEPTPEPVQPTGNESVLPDVGSDEIKGEERLPGEDATALSLDDPAASVDPSVLAGSQSLLLEASTDGTSGAVPFSGTVEWSEGVDELGMPTLIGSASIPARNLGVDITIRKNSDPSLPASHLMEVDFNVSDTFIGGSIATLPGILLKDEELVPGSALIGASARVVGNSFLFALSASPTDAETNTELLENRRWIDLAVVYGTGRNAILTLEKDEAAQALFGKVFTAWAQ